MMDFPNNQVNTSVLYDEITSSSIITTLSHINTEEELSVCNIMFVDELPTVEEDTLDGIVTTHSGIYVAHVDIQITESPSTSGASMFFDKTTGVLYTFDTYRNAWLSNQKNSLTFFRKGNVKNMYLPLSGDLDYVLVSHMTGRPSKLIGVFCKSEDGSDTQGFEIRKNGVMLYEFNYPGSGTRIYSNYNLNFNIEINDKLQIYVKSGDIIFNTFCRLDLAWRYDI